MDSLFTIAENYLVEQGFRRECGNWLFRNFVDFMEVTIKDGVMTTELVVFFSNREAVDFKIENLV